MASRMPAPAQTAPSRLRPLPRGFYARSVLAVARDLLGHLLVHDGPGGRTVGRIVEVEAYRGADDPASHAYRLTPRSRIMAGPPGVAYVYFTYGNHHCVNVVTGPPGVASAVLLRAIEPVDGIGLMARRRGTGDLRRLASGPGRLTQAMGISAGHNGWDLTRPPLFIADGRLRRRTIGRSPRIGIRRAADRPWRFFLRGSPYVSRQPLSTRTAELRWDGGARRARRDRPRRSPRPAPRN